MLRITQILMFVSSILGMSLFLSFSAYASEKTLNLRLQAFNIYLNPPLLVDSDSRRIVEMVHARLIRKDKAGIIHAELAESWVWNGSKIEFKIRDDATYSNGAKVLASDAALSLCQLLQPSSPYSWMLSSVVSEVTDTEVKCTGIKAVSEQILSIEVSEEGRGALMDALSTAPASILPQLNNEPGEFGSRTGAGAYIVERIVANEEVILQARDDDVWEASASKVEFKLISDDQAAGELFKAGSLDILEINTPKLLASIAEVSSDEVKLRVPGRLYGVDVAQLRMLIVNEDRVSTELGVAKEDVAGFVALLKESIDYDEILATAGRLGKRSHSSFPPGEDFGFTKLPADAGKTFSGELSIISTNDEFADIIASKLPTKVSDVRLKVEGLPKTVAVNRMVKRDYAIMNMWFEAIIDKPIYWSAFFTPGRPFTLFGTEIDDLKGIDLNSEIGVKTANQLINEQGNWIPLFLERRYYAIQPNVSNEYLLSTGLISYQEVKKR